MRAAVGRVRAAGCGVRGVVVHVVCGWRRPCPACLACLVGLVSLAVAWAAAASTAFAARVAADVWWQVLELGPAPVDTKEQRCGRLKDSDTTL